MVRSKKTIVRHWRGTSPFIALLVALAARTATAEPLRLRGDAFVQAPSAIGPNSTGLLVLSGDDKVTKVISAEGSVWVGTGAHQDKTGINGGLAANTTGDVVSLAIKIRDPEGHGDLRFGRLLVGMGTLRPIHLDGVSGIARAPWGTTVEAFGGVPVVPRFGYRAYDWAVGGRISQAASNKFKVGVAYLQRRHHGDASAEELGADVTILPMGKWEVASKLAYDLSTMGLADLGVTTSLRFTGLRFEAFLSRRSAAHLLPETSLFSVLGDAPSTRLGGTIRWVAAPRLDVLTSFAMHAQDGHTGYNAFVRTLLRLSDDERGGTLGLEIRRQGLPQTGWSGIRGTASVPLSSRLRASTELELAAPDHPNHRGVVWPWALAAMTYRATSRWDVAVAGEASARPTVAREMTALLRASYAWDR